MTETPSTLNHVACQIQQVDFTLAEAPCDRCGARASRVDVARRTAIDIALDHPIVLLVRVSVHRCTACRHYFRAQPPFLRPDAIYTQRVVRKAVEAVYADGMAFRRVGDRLARDFWVRPSEAMIRRWCRAYGAGLVGDETYDAWVTAEFSGILCVDEVYQRDLALLLAVDPAAPEGDRLVGYHLVHGPVDASSVAEFRTRLATAGIQPEQVISDGSPLYPAVLAQVWPQAAPQLCLFHGTRRVTRAVRTVIEGVRRAVPAPPRSAPRRQGGPLRPRPRAADGALPPPPTPPQYERKMARHQEIVRAQALAREGFSPRAIGRHVGATHSTVKRWLAAPTAFPPSPPPEPVAPPRWLSCPFRPEARLRTLKEQGLSPSAIARETGLPPATIARWLRDQAAGHPSRVTQRPPPRHSGPESGRARPRRRARLRTGRRPPGQPGSRCASCVRRFRHTAISCCGDPRT
jgi:hypothetical protein